MLLPGNTTIYEHEPNYFSNQYRTDSIDWWEECSDQVAALIPYLHYE
jgi:hypothetical protein